jgi:hypothetical protein
MYMHIFHLLNLSYVNEIVITFRSYAFALNISSVSFGDKFYATVILPESFNFVLL